jgi:uncharacterized membrane-anchored protein
MKKRIQRATALWFRPGFGRICFSSGMVGGLLLCLWLVMAFDGRGAAALERESAQGSLHWVEGPTNASLSDIANVDVPSDYLFIDGESTRKFMEAMGNFTSGQEVGLIAPTGLVWFAVFRFSDEGYVKDDDKDKLNADQILSSIRNATESGNRERKRLGRPTMKVVGWQMPPIYNETTHNLEWAVIGESEGARVVNYNTRILGRRGVMEVKLVVASDALETHLGSYKELLATFAYQGGERYAEYKPGDKLAKYGLTALVAGGAVAVAAKTGLLAAIILLFKKAWKVVIIALVAVGAVFKRLIHGRSSPPQSD